MDRPIMQFSAILADDENSILQGLEGAVDWTALGIRIVALATNGKDALDAIIEHQPDVAIIDIKMPGLNGLEVMQRVRNSGIQTEFIILSGYDDFSYAKEAIRYGAKAYLLKPLNSMELYDELYRICLARSRHSNRSLYQERLNLDFFNKLVDSKILEPGIIQETLKSTDIHLRDTDCCVYALLWDPNEAKQGLPLTQVLERLDTEFATEQHIFWKYNEHQINGIFNVSGIVPFQTAMRCLQVLQEAGVPLPVIGLGDTVSSLMECSYSYNRAITATTYQLYDDSAHIFTYEVICVTPPTMMLSDIDYLPLVQYIVKKDAEGIRRYCDTFMEQILYVRMPPPNYVFTLCYALFHQIEQEFSSFSHEEITQIASAQDLYQFRRLQEIQEWLVSSFCQLAEFIDAVYGYATPRYASSQRLTTEVDDDIIRSAMEFVHSNITNHIKLEDIARQVHLSPSYFAIYFKNKTGINLRDYLLTEKMEYARKALMNPDTVIGDVAYALGYGDYRSFSRAFKNVHGITPSDFQASKNDGH